MADPFASLADSVFAPARSVVAITASDSTDYLSTGKVPKSLYVLTSGNLSVQGVDDASASAPFPVTAGMILPIRVRKVMATNTTATVLGLC